MADRKRSFGVTLMAASLLVAMASLTGCGPGAKARADGSAASGGKPGMDNKDSAPQGAWTRSDAKIRIRLHNLDTLPLENVFVQWPVDSARFPSLPARGYTDYVAVDKAYRYAYIKAQSGARTWICQPMDFVGETLLEPGRYTYEIARAAIMDSAGNGPGFLSLEMLTDKEHP
jgi:hypothetical protein